jgi:hypothetical protein
MSTLHTAAQTFQSCWAAHKAAKDKKLPSKGWTTLHDMRGTTHVHEILEPLHPNKSNEGATDRICSSWHLRVNFKVKFLLLDFKFESSWFVFPRLPTESSLLLLRRKIISKTNLHTEMLMGFLAVSQKLIWQIAWNFFKLIAYFLFKYYHINLQRNHELNSRQSDLGTFLYSLSKRLQMAI